jgi:hypothetical protein
MPMNTLGSLIRRCKVTRTTRGGNGRMVEVEYESLPEKYKRRVIEKYGNPYEYTGKTAIKQYLTVDYAAAKYFNDYRCEGDIQLPPSHINSCIEAAQWLNMIIKFTGKENKKYLKPTGLTREQFWSIVCELIDKEGIDLPSSYSRLTRKVKEYQDGPNYEVLVSKKFGNKNTEKITEAAGDWLVAMYALPIKYTVSQLFLKYNQEAQKKGWKQLRSENTIDNYLSKREVEWYGPRHGERMADQKFGIEIKTIKPTFRDAIWESDGTGLNYRIKGVSKNMKLYAITDAFSEVILGWHIDDEEEHAMQFLAAKMALKFAQAKPYEWRYDNQGGHKKLSNQGFFNKVAHLHFAVQPYNGKSKTIENIFARFQTQVLRQDWFYTGQNITTKKLDSKENTEWIIANKKNFPTIDEVFGIMHERVAEWNNMPHPKTGQPRIEMYRKSQNPHHRPVDALEMALLFWLRTDKQIIYRNTGIKLQVGGQPYEFEVLSEGLPDLEFRRKYIGEKFWVKYDPEDMSMVYLCTGVADDLRLVAMAEPRVEIHRAIADQKPGERELLVKQLELRKKDNRDRREKSKLVAEKVGITPDSLIDGFGQYLKKQSMALAPMSLYDNDDFEEGRPLM